MGQQGFILWCIANTFNEVVVMNYNPQNESIPIHNHTSPPPPSIIMSKKDETFEFSNEKKFV